jgi:hypothetical protein
MLQHTRPESEALIYGNLPNNTSGTIDPEKLREVLLVLVASFLNLLDDGNPVVGGGAAIPQPAQATFGNLGGQAADNASLVSYVAALGHTLSEYLPPMATQQGRWYLAGTGIWEAKSNFNAAAPPAAGAYWRLVVDFGDALTATAAGKALLAAPTATAQRQLLDIFITTASQYGAGQPAFTNAYQPDGALVYLLKQVDYLRTQLAASASPAKPAAPTNGQVDDTADTFSFLPNPAYPSFAQYKVNGLPGITGAVALDGQNSYVSGSRVCIKVVGAVAKGGLAVYVAGSGAVPDGAVLTNADAFTGAIVVAPPTGSTPDAPLSSFDPTTRTLTYQHALGTSELEINRLGGSFQPYAAVQVDDAAHQAGEWKARVKAYLAGNRNASGTADSPAIAQKTVTNRIPVADAGQDLTIQLPTSSVALMGAASDPDTGDTLTYAWRYVTGPNVPTGLPAATLNVVISNLIAGTYQIGFRSTDNYGAQSVEDYVLLTVLAVTGGGAASFPTQMGLSINSARQASLYPAAAAQDYTYTFTSLPLPGATVITPPAGAIKLSSVSGVVSDANILEGSTSYGTDATTAIQQFLQQGALNATANNPFNVDWDVAVGISGALLLSSYTNIYARPTCGAILRPNSNCAIFQNANARNFSVRDTNIGIYGPGIWNHNGFSGTTPPTSDPGFNQTHSSNTIGWCCPIRIYNVDNFTWNGGMIIRQRTFALHAINTTGMVLKNGIINAGSNGASLNSDGLHLNFTNTNFIIDNWQIASHDDKLAISANDSLDRDVRGGNSTYYQQYFQGQTPLIDGGTVTNIEFTGGVFGIRVLSGANVVRNVSFKGIYGATGGYWLIMNNFWQVPVFDGGGPGYVSNLTFEDVFVSNTNSGEGYINECCANINCNATGLTFRNVNRNTFTQSEFPSFLFSGAATVVSDVTIDNYQSHDLDSNGFTNALVVVRDAAVSGLKLINSKISRVGGASSNRVVELVSGSLSDLMLSNVQVDGLANVVNQTGGTLGNVTASSVYHTNAGPGSGSFNSTVSPGPKVTATSTTTQQLLQGTFTT